MSGFLILITKVRHKPKRRKELNIFDAYEVTDCLGTGGHGLRRSDLKSNIFILGWSDSTTPISSEPKPRDVCS